MGAVDLGGGKERGPKKGKRKKKRIPVKIDMTPMVDIAFLLLIFFMVTAVFRTPQALEINLPPKDVQIPIAQSNILTLRVLPGSRIFWNSGEVPPAPITIDKLAATLKDANARNTKLVVLIKAFSYRSSRSRSAAATATITHSSHVILLGRPGPSSSSMR